MKPMYMAREKGEIILSYVGFSKIYDIIKSFPESKIILAWYYFSSIIKFKSDWMEKWTSYKIRIICGSNWYKSVRWLQNQ